MRNTGATQNRIYNGKSESTKYKFKFVLQSRLLNISDTGGAEHKHKKGAHSRFRFPPPNIFVFFSPSTTRLHFATTATSSHGAPCYCRIWWRCALCRSRWILHLLCFLQHPLQSRWILIPLILHLHIRGPPTNSSKRCIICFCCSRWWAKERESILYPFSNLLLHLLHLLHPQACLSRQLLETRTRPFG